MMAPGSWHLWPIAVLRTELLYLQKSAGEIFQYTVISIYGGTNQRLQIKMLFGAQEQEHKQRTHK